MLNLTIPRISIISLNILSSCITLGFVNISSLTERCSKLPICVIPFRYLIFYSTIVRSSMVTPGGLWCYTTVEPLILTGFLYLSTLIMGDFDFTQFIVRNIIFPSSVYLSSLTTRDFDYPSV